MAFRGSYELRTDDKGRIIVPLKFRAKLGEQFIITKGPGNCLFVMTEDDWRRSFEEKFENERFLDPHLMRVERFFRDGLMETSFDTQGRVAINQKLREYAGLAFQSDILVIGMNNRLEIWSKERWDSLNDTLTDESLIQSAAEIGIGRGAL